jgi:hypothetical protein
MKIETAKNVLYIILSFFKKFEADWRDIREYKRILPLYLIFWLPMTLTLSMALFYHIRWDFFGITEGVNPYYLNRCDSSFDMYKQVAKEMGYIGNALCLFLAISYLWMCRVVCLATFY